MSKAEALLKVILSPVDSVTDTYRALLPKGTPMEFRRILEFKGLKKADQQSILDDFNKHWRGMGLIPISNNFIENKTCDHLCFAHLNFMVFFVIFIIFQLCES